MTHFASGVGFASSISVRNDTPCHELSSVVQPVTQCMSAGTSTFGSARSSWYESVTGFSTSPVSSRSQFCPSNVGIGP